jgi:DNA-binding IclR family transcriptional regulator
MARQIVEGMMTLEISHSTQDAGQAGRIAALSCDPPAARIQSIGRAKAILDVLSHQSDWVRLRDIAARTGLVKATAFNLVTALADVGLVEHDAARGAYRLGLHALVYGRAVERRLDAVAVLRPHLVRLCAETSETVNLALPGPLDCIIVESLEGSQTLRVTAYSGTRASYYATACGRALLAFKPEAERRHVLGLSPLRKLTPNTTTDIGELEAILADCRRDGYVCEIEENEIGGACVAAPVLLAGKPMAAVSIAGPAFRMDERKRRQLGELLVAALGAASHDLSAALRAGG